METRLCPECSEPIRGRIDKKFCSDLCRNSFNNKVNSDSNNYVRNINNALRKNRRLLEEHLSGATTRVPRQKLANKGFNFSHYTSHLLTSNQHTYYYCYEFGYRYLENDQLMIVKKRFDS